MKVLYVHSSLNLGGAQSVRYMFLKNLDSGRFDIRVCCLGKKGEFGERIEKLGYQVDALNKQDGLFKFSTTLRLYRYLKNYDFDIVHSSLFFANYHSALAAAWARVPCIIIEEHGEHFLHYKRKYLAYRILGRKIANISNLIFCCSDYVKKGVAEVYNVKNKEKLLVLKNLVGDKRMEIEREKKDVRAELNIPQDAIVMGTVSSLYWLKNHKILIESMRQDYGQEVFLVIVGDGLLKDDLVRQAQELGISHWVRFTGWRNDVADILNAFDIFVLPSLSEGLPICLLEAMSIGLPCIASRVGGVGEILQDGVNGILVRAGRIDDLTLALKRLIADTDERARLGLAARRHVLDGFKPSDYVEKVTNAYAKITHHKIY